MAGMHFAPIGSTGDRLRQLVEDLLRFAHSLCWDSVRG
jgi:hypothetical protein